eukprot:scaffold22759_cov111-Isochrysis_galbana.AAC.4
MATDLIGGRKPTQYVQPYEHGTGHQKATGLYLTDNLPILKPTCLMDERTSAMADLPRIFRGHHIAERYAAERTLESRQPWLSLQWMPTLIAYWVLQEKNKTP